MSKKLTIPKSVKNLKLTPKKFAKKNGIRISGKGLSKSEKKHNKKRLNKEYAEQSIVGLNKAVKILVEHPEGKNIDKVKKGVDNVITNPDVMKRIVKIYKQSPESYPNLIYLPWMIMNTLVYYQSDNISDEEKEIGKALDTEALVDFCEKILKKQIKRYKSFGLSETQAFQLATTIPTTKIFSNRIWYRRLTQCLYDIAQKESVDFDLVMKSVVKLDKKKGIKKKEFLTGYFSEFIMQKSSNKNAKFTDDQKDLHETMIDRALTYLDSLKPRKCKSILKNYINRRKKAEEAKNDSKRVIRFIDHANSNSPYTNIKAVVQELISDNSSNELYLS